MNKQKQIIAIMLSRGWTLKKEQCSHSSSVTEWYWWVPGRAGMVTPDYQTSTQTMFPSGNVVGEPIPAHIPDYLNDAKACAEIVNSLSISDGERYGEFLCQEVLGFGPDKAGTICLTQWALFRVLKPTTEQICKAYLLAKNLWTDEA